ncbi:glycyl radical protein [Chloroflexota bacterium]
MTTGQVQETGTGSTDRVGRLRAQMLCTPELCIERARLMTESYRETESEPPIIRRAKALAYILARMTIGIEDGELIVGRATKKRRAAVLTPEINCELYREIAAASSDEWDINSPLSEAEKAEMQEFLPYWQGKSLYDKWRAIALEDGLKFQFHTHMPGPNPFNNQNLGHCSPSYSKILALGLNGLKVQAEEKVAALDLAQMENLAKYRFYKAVITTLEAAAGFAARYAALARQMAGQAATAEKKAELEHIAEICENVPANPARTFHEALQAMWLTYIVLMQEGWAPGIGFGRADQYLYPLYKKDIEEGRLTREQARELVSLLYIKLNEPAGPLYGFGKTLPGYAALSNFTLGGITPDGRDAVNELSYLFLDAEKDVGLHGEEVVIRVNRNNPEAFLMKACEVARTLRGKLKFISDDTAMQQLLHDGKPLEYARDYVVVGCLIPTVPGRTFESAVAEFLNMPLLLELALNNGVSRLTGEQMGPATGDPRQFQSYEDVWQAFSTQVAALLRRRLPDRNDTRKLYGDFLPTPFQSALFEPCFEKGIDITEGGTAPHLTQAWSICGVPDVGDSLAAIKKVVFEEKKVTLDRLLDALERDFEGDEELQHLLAGAPKFGNDDDYVDSIVNDVFMQSAAEASQYTGFGGAICNIQAGAVNANLAFGRVVGALPDGRKAGEPLAEGGISPHQGRNISGPTATLRSVAKIDNVKLTGGTVLNMRFNPEVLQDEVKMRKFAALIRTYFETGGFLVQFNIVSSDMLRDAQADPVKFRDLLVRVATYSAYFVELPKDLQDDIINRMEFQGV